MINKVILLGNIGRQPELSTTPNGNSVLKFSLATSHRWKDKDGMRQEKTAWHGCELWGSRAEKLKPYLLKGTRIYVEGSLDYQSWDDKTTGEKKYKTVISVDDVQFFGNDNNANKTSVVETIVPDVEAERWNPPETLSDDDIPF